MTAHARMLSCGCCALGNQPHSTITDSAAQTVTCKQCKPACFPPACVPCLPLQGHKGELQQMYEEWPFFAATIDLIEMILAKADMRIAALYDDVLVSDPAGKKLGIELRQKFAECVRAICEVGYMGPGLVGMMLCSSSTLLLQQVSLILPAAFSVQLLYCGC